MEEIERETQGKHGSRKWLHRDNRIMSFWAIFSLESCVVMD